MRCDNCDDSVIARGRHADVTMCLKCNTLKLTCTECGGSLRADPKTGYKEFRCINCNHGTNFHNEPDEAQLPLFVRVP